MRNQQKQSDLMTVSAGFARLMATENIGVRIDTRASTASFDTQARVLTMPNWDASDRLRDMLVAHECAHAIFTDATDLPTLVRERVGANFAIAKDYLNVVEDARIDRLIQRRYPGTRRDYAAGYREMIEKDFFGINGRNVNRLPLIDRINLHFKGMEGKIAFDAIERTFVDRIEAAETFDEVCEIARDLYEYAASKKQEEQEQQEQNAAGAGSEGEEEDGEDTQSLGGEQSEEGEEDAAAAPAGTEESEEECGTEEDAAASNGYDKDPSPCTTQQELERNQQSLVNDDVRDSVTAFRFPRLAGINLDKIIFPYASILAEGEGTISPGQFDSWAKEWQEFKSGAKATVQHLASMFDRKKAAAVAARTQVAKTGRLDMTMLHKYKMTEDIFLRNRIEIKGKNHGIVVYVDWSGSMNGCMEETIAQATVLAMFCKKVGIPFRVYGFTTFRNESRNVDPYSLRRPEDHLYEAPLDYTLPWDAPERRERMNLAPFSLLEIFSSEMSNQEFDRMGTYLRQFAPRRAQVIRCLQLTGTPLNESIIAAMPIGLKFKATYNIDVLNSIWLTDGEGGNPFFGAIGTTQIRETGEVFNITRDRSGTDTLFRIYKRLVGGNLIGFFLDTKKRIESTIYYSGDRNAQARIEKFRTNKFIEQKHDGYDTYFLLDKSVAVYTGSDTMESLPETASSTRVLNAFRKDLVKRAISRPLLNSITDRIAKEMV